jgi:hypothetical protein
VTLCSARQFYESRSIIIPHASNAGVLCTQLGKDTDDPYPTLQPKDEEGIVLAEFDLDEIAEARHRYVWHGNPQCGHAPSVVRTDQTAHIMSLMTTWWLQLGIVQRPEARPIWANPDERRLNPYQTCLTSAAVTSPGHCTTFNKLMRVVP